MFELNSASRAKNWYSSLFYISLTVDIPEREKEFIEQAKVIALDIPMPFVQYILGNKASYLRRLSDKSKRQKLISLKTLLEQQRKEENDILRMKVLAGMFIIAGLIMVFLLIFGKPPNNMDVCLCKKHFL